MIRSSYLDNVLLKSVNVSAVRKEPYFDVKSDPINVKYTGEGYGEIHFEYRRPGLFHELQATHLEEAMATEMGYFKTTKHMVHW